MGEIDITCVHGKSHAMQTKGIYRTSAHAHHDRNIQTHNQLHATSTWPGCLIAAAPAPAAPALSARAAERAPLATDRLHASCVVRERGHICTPQPRTHEIFPCGATGRCAMRPHGPHARPNGGRGGRNRPGPGVGRNRTRMGTRSGEFGRSFNCGPRLQPPTQGDGGLLRTRAEYRGRGVCGRRGGPCGRRGPGGRRGGPGRSRAPRVRACETACGVCVHVLLPGKCKVHVPPHLTARLYNFAHPRCGDMGQSPEKPPVHNIHMVPQLRNRRGDGRESHQFI